MTGMRLSRRLVRALPAVFVTVGLSVAAVGFATSPSETVAAPSPTPTARPTLAPPPLPRVAPLRQRVPTHLVVIAAAPLTAVQERALIAATGARAALAVSAGTVYVEKGRTTALAVDPGVFRAWTPKGTAEVDQVWQSVAAGEGAVAHVVGRAFELPLGGPVATRAASSLTLRVGSFTTTALPGIGLVVDAAVGTGLGLRAHTGLLLSAPQRPATDSADLARTALARLGLRGVAVRPVQYARTTSRASWVVPVIGRVTSPFGQRIHPLTHLPQFHEGIDVGARLGAPVYAMSAGEVLYAGPARGFGTEIVLSHAGGVTTVYGHVSALLVSSGPVRAGQAIALVGNEGDSTGPHLHAEVRVDDRPVDPVAWLRAHGVRL